MWKIEKIVSKGEYNYAVVKEHPNAIKCGYVLEHRIIMENSLNRLLNSNEIVHHINGKKKDNRIENLEVKSREDHTREHTTKGRKMVLLKYPNCGKHFERRRVQTYLAKKGLFSACSRMCRGKFSRKIQLEGRTSEVEQAISGNIVLEFHSSDNPEETEDNGIRRGHTPAV